MRRKKKGGQKPLAELVAAVYPRREPQELQAYRAFRWWDRAVPARVATNARPVRLERGILHVHVTTSAWAQELQFLKPELLRSVQAKATAGTIRDLRFRVAPLPDLPPRTEPVTAPTVPLPVSHLPEEVARALVQVRSEELRNALTATASLTLGRKKAQK